MNPIAALKKWLHRRKDAKYKGEFLANAHAYMAESQSSRLDELLAETRAVGRGRTD